ncbi:hypothetical protein [Rhizobium leguminosarum]|uniref:Uncharacterized protein n=1 Tax=Rhizobium leguminosarum TaxID=384 RepID=A0A7K3VT24_RHILE|nr:hypothetical protein [Rhizobium leguminosarum]NEK20303.1 hypothetical protein [Rhizobium leguminosarum]
MDMWVSFLLYLLQYTAFPTMLQIAGLRRCGLARKGIAASAIAAQLTTAAAIAN